MATLTESPETLRDICAVARVRPVDIAKGIPVSKTTASGWLTGRVRVRQPYHFDRLRFLLRENGVIVSPDRLAAALEATRAERDGERKP